MPRKTLDEYFLALLPHVATRSTCARRAVGAIITDARGAILATGYNGVPSGVPHCVDTPCPGAAYPSGRGLELCWAVHAEQNALLQCHRLDLARRLYVSCAPCFTCAKLIRNTPLTRLVVAAEYADPAGLQLLTTKADLIIRVGDSRVWARGVWWDDVNSWAEESP